MTEVNLEGYDIAIRPLNNGWYEASTMTTSMGEEYREHKRYDHEPTYDDLKHFINTINANR